MSLRWRTSAKEFRVKILPKNYQEQNEHQPCRALSSLSTIRCMTSFDVPPSCATVPCLDTAKRCLGEVAWNSDSKALSGAPKISADSCPKTAANWFSDSMTDLVKQFCGQVIWQMVSKAQLLADQ